MPVPDSPKILDKSWLFEIFDTRHSRVEKSFTLIFPPQAIVIKEPQRVALTKTFDNIFVDDYGPDNIEITINAISGSTKVFPTFRTTGEGMPASPSLNPEIAQFLPSSPIEGGPLGYDRRSAFYTFRDDIMRYKDRGAYEYKELRVYDLYDSQAYKCILIDFTRV